VVDRYIHTDVEAIGQAVGLIFEKSKQARVALGAFLDFHESLMDDIQKPSN
jgi:hypothetical protein